MRNPPHATCGKEAYPGVGKAGEVDCLEGLRSYFIFCLMKASTLAS